MKDIKIYHLTFITTILFVVLVISGRIYGYDSIVTGKNDPQHDVKNIQIAVDKGGSIFLKGIFDFGLKGRVTIKKDVEVIGESNDGNNRSTKIKGGFWCFHSPLPSTETPLPDIGPKIKIKNIHFDGALWAPLHFPYTSGSVISGNRITNVKPYAIPIKWAGGDNLLVSAGVLIGTRFAHREKFIPRAVTGHQIFENNHVDLKCAEPLKTMSQGAFYIWTWGAIIEIRRNTIRNVSRNAIESLDNYLDEEGRGSIVISENNIVTPSIGVPFPSPSTPNGIMVGWFLDMAGGSDPEKNSKITIINNFVRTNGKSSLGITSLSNNTAILGNRVEINGGANSRGIVQIGSNGFIARNQIDGNGAWAMQAFSYKGIRADRNTFAWNDIRNFKASGGDFLCAGNKNIFVGAKCKFVNKGENNKSFVAMH